MDLLHRVAQRVAQANELRKEEVDTDQYDQDDDRRLDHAARCEERQLGAIRLSGVFSPDGRGSSGLAELSSGTAGKLPVRDPLQSLQVAINGVDCGSASGSAPRTAPTKAAPAARSVT